MFANLSRTISHIKTIFQLINSFDYSGVTNYWKLAEPLDECLSYLSAVDDVIARQWECTFLCLGQFTLGCSQSCQWSTHTRKVNVLCIWYHSSLSPVYRWPFLDTESYLHLSVSSPGVKRHISTFVVWIIQWVLDLKQLSFLHYHLTWLCILRNDEFGKRVTKIYKGNASNNPRSH